MPEINVDLRTATTDLRIHLAKNEYCLEQLVRDPHPEVRLAVAQQGYGLPILVEDLNFEVRTAAIKRSYDINLQENMRKLWTISRP